MKLKTFFAFALLFAASAAFARGSQCENLFVPENPSRPEVTVEKLFDAYGIKIGGAAASDITVHDASFYRRFVSDPEFELGEAYMDGLWDSPAIDQFTTKILEGRHRDGDVKLVSRLWRNPALASLALLKTSYRYFRDRFTNRQTRGLSKRVAEEHYDIGNELYRRMLDPTLTYTSGVWARGYTLEDAQNAKYDLIARKLDLKPGQRVLDIGSGFGGFARFAARYYGAKVTGITISIEQLRAARALSEGVAGVEFVFSDYRDIPHRFAANTFDHVVSIEMVEAVGIKNLKEYFDAAAASMKDGGRFVIQSIAQNEDVVNSNPWFSKYIFPDGVAPSVNQLDRAASASFGAAVDRHQFTSSYDKTLMAWHDQFSNAWPDLHDAYTPRFKRMWDFYLLSVAAAFRTGRLQVGQSIYVKGAHRENISFVRDLPSTERLTSMRATEQQIARTSILIGELETERAQNQAREPRPRPYSPAVKTPLAKSARIAVIGAGPAGLSAADELKKLGYTNVVVFEKQNSVGGKSHTVTIAGRPHDLGATMGVPIKYDGVRDLATRAGEKTIAFPPEVQYDLARGGAVKMSLARNLRLAYEGLLYLIQYSRIKKAGALGLEVPSNEASDPWTVVMSRAGLPTFGDAMNTYLTGYGYGYGGPETPAVFGMRMLSPNTIIGAALSKSIMWENGTQPIWKSLGRGLNVRTSTEVTHIARTDRDVLLSIQGRAVPEQFDQVVIAVDPTIALSLLDATAEETDLFSRVRYTPYATYAVRVKGLAEGSSEVGYLKENMNIEKQGHPMAWIKRHADDDVFVFHLFAPKNLSDADIMANIEGDLRKLGATQFTLVDSRRWPFFPHVDPTAMREGQFFARAAQLQGQNRTIYINEVLGMSTMADSVELARRMANRLATGEVNSTAR